MSSGTGGSTCSGQSSRIDSVATAGLRLLHQFFCQFVRFADLRLEFFAGAGPFETAVDLLHLSIPADEQGRGIRKEIVDLAAEPTLDVRFVDRTAEEQGIRQTETVFKEREILLCKVEIV